MNEALESETFTPNKTTKFLYKVCKTMYLTAAPNFWFGVMKLPKTLIKLLNSLSHFIDILLCLFVLFEWGAFFTQHGLSEKQAADRALMSMAHFFQNFFGISFKRHRNRARRILYKLAVELRAVHNDLEVEKQMIAKIKLYALLHVFMAIATVAVYGVDAMVQSLFGDSTFTTVIPAWPDVNDWSKLAGVARVLLYLVWWIFVIRVGAAYTLLITLTNCLSHQYRNLASYFHSLNGIFDGDGAQIEKERRYEDAVKVGIKSHVVTLWCHKECQTVCNAVFSGQIIVNVTVLVLLMAQMVDPERSASATAKVAVTMFAMLLSTGFFMWSAGDITVEAAHLPTAMYASGWHRCGGAAGVRVRRLLGVAVPRAQRQVEMVCLGIVTLSYASYVSIVKSSYSVFSVLY